MKTILFNYLGAIKNEKAPSATMLILPKECEKPSTTTGLFMFIDCIKDGLSICSKRATEASVLAGGEYVTSPPR